VALDIGKILLAAADKQKAVKSVRSEIRYYSAKITSAEAALEMCVKAYNDLQRQIPELQKQVNSYQVTLTKRMEWLRNNESQEEDAADAEKLALRIKKIVKELEKLKAIQAGTIER
jgi:chromosome segregation ATPase